ncbi:MAG TPA: hypothetical protein VG899_15370 [Mycobacteriales bacterium]|nr:hypothetical protein [Mycobacteriales bacterium]
MSTVTPSPEVRETAGLPGPESVGAIDFAARPARLRGLSDPASLLPTYLGVVLTLAGFALLGIAWSKIAGLADVWRQMPYLVSAALPGLGLVMTGLVVINVSSRRQDGAARARQMETIAEALHDLQRSIDR